MTRIVALSAVLSLAATACMHAGHAATASTAQPATAAPAAPEQGGMAALCPMSIPGTRVSAADTSTGEAVTFTTSPDQAPALRAKVHAMADMHNRHHAGAAAGEGGHAGMMGGHHGHGGMMGGEGHGEHAATGEGASGAETGAMHMPPPSRATVEDLPDGARLVVTPIDAADLAQLQQTVRMHAEQMQEHGCGMMQHPQG